MADYVLICDSTGSACEPVGATQFVGDVINASAANADPVVLGQFFGAGFLIVGTAWAIGESVRVLLQFIRSA